MRYEYKIKRSILGNEPVWRGYYRPCWPLPWAFIKNSMAWNEAAAIAACYEHAKSVLNRRVTVNTVLGRLPPTAEENGF